MCVCSYQNMQISECLWYFCDHVYLISFHSSSNALLNFLCVWNWPLSYHQVNQSNCSTKDITRHLISKDVFWVLFFGSTTKRDKETSIRRSSLLVIVFETWFVNRECYKSSKCAGCKKMLNKQTHSFPNISKLLIWSQLQAIAEKAGKTLSDQVFALFLC